MIHVKKNRGQGTTEYLIILAIVIVIALVVVGVLGGFPSMGTGVSQSQSKAYWGSTQPLAVVDWSISATSGSSAVVLQNNSSGTITLVHVKADSVSYGNTSSIAPGGKATVSTMTNITCTTPGQPYSKTFSYRYTTANSLTLDFNGTVPLSGTCQP